MATSTLFFNIGEAIFMEVTVNYRLSDEQSNVKSEGAARSVLDEKYLTLVVEFGEPMLFAYTDITGICDHDYKIDLFLTSKQTLTLSGLGYQYEDFLFQLYKLRNELLLRYLLMGEALVQAAFEAHFNWLDPNGQPNQTGECEVRLYETALVVLPQKGEPIRVPYCYISQTSKADYKLVVISEFEEKFEFSRLGEKFDPLAKGLSDAFNKMMLRSQEIVKEMIPEADPVTVWKLAALMKDGRAARRKDIEPLSPDFWRRLTNRVKEAGMSSEYDFLNSMALTEQVCVGVKRGLMGDLTGSYIWLLFPLRDAETGKLSNAVALEAFSTDQGNAGDQEEGETEAASLEENADQQGTSDREASASGKATYFFRMKPRRDYVLATEEEMTIELENFVKNVNRCMIDINFRREPIFLSEDELDSPKYVQSRFAVAKLPSLRTLRSLFIGRVIHSSFSQWKNDVTSLLDFNNKIKNDNEKWKKGAE
jgi:hypothetical protein